MPEPKKIAVAILNWNGQELLRRFLPSVIPHSRDLAEIYVIDNASQDDSVAILQTEFPTVKIIRLDENHGYAGGYNLGIQKIKEELIVLLNSDVETTENWLQPLFQHFIKNEKLGALQPKILDLKAPEKFEYAGAAGGFIDRLGYPFCRGRLFFELENDRGQYEKYRDVFWASGACLMVRKSAYLAAGGLNQILFAHFEEIDLCWRMHLGGWQVGCEPTATVFHLGGATLSDQSPRKTFLNFRNGLIIMFLNLPDGEALGKILLRMVLDGVAAVKFLFEKKPRHSWAVFRAHSAFYAKFAQLARLKASQNFEPQPLQDLPGVYRRWVVWDFFKKGKKKFSELDF